MTKSFVILLFFSHFCYGQSYEVSRNTKLAVTCPQLLVKMNGTPSVNQLQVQSNSSNVVIKKDPIEDLIRIDCEGSDTKAQLTLQGAPIAARFNLGQGSISVQDWTQDLHVVLEKGSVTTKKTSGFIKIFLQTGQVDVQEHASKLKVDTFNSKINVVNVTGAVEVRNFNGSSSLKGIKSDLNIDSRSGTFQIEDVQGSLRYDVDNGKLEGSAIAGDIEGVSDQASVQLKLMSPARLKAKVKNGQYRIQIPSSSGAQVYMAFEDGQYQVPSFLKQDVYGSMKTVRGTLRGNDTGRINITGEIGKVSLSTF